MIWKVPYVDLSEQFKALRQELIDEITRVMSSGNFILRDDVDRFEQNMANYLGVKHVIGVNSGTDALTLAVGALGLERGCEVITVAHTFVATVAAVVHIGGRPVLVDIKEDFNIDVQKVEQAITERTRAIIPVHLNGRMCQMDELEAIAEKYDLIIIEDAAQALGSMFKGKKAGSFGAAGCFSLHPMKTLGCAGDGGFISTDDDRVANKIRLLRNHGQRSKTDIVCFGYNSRLDNLQAALLNVKMDYLDNNYIHRKREIAARYSVELFDLPLTLPQGPDDDIYFDTYSSYVIRTTRQQHLFTYLREKSVEVFIHMPQPLYKHAKLGIPDRPLPVNEKICNEIISLPICPELTDDQVEYVIMSIREFFRCAG
jgi:dTDP-4-amino-4,6-dideoxygalactose transaminase